MRQRDGLHFPSSRAVGRGRGWYRGDVHVHSAVSNGADLAPAQLAAAARAAGLDFIATTDHNTSESHGQWGPCAGDDLLVILGQEVTTRDGHWLAVGIAPGQVVEWRYGVRDGLVDRGLDEVRGAGGLCIAAHPHAPYPTGTFGYPYGGFDAVEVWNGRWRSDVPWQADNEAALAEWGRSLAAGVHGGRWRPSVGNSDAHLDGQLGTPQTVVLAEELSVEAVLAGIRAGRCWIAESADVELSVAVSAGGQRAGVGEILRPAGAPVEARVEVAGVPSGAVAVHTERGAVHRAALPADGSGRVVWWVDAPDPLFVRVEVRHRDGRMAALSNPVVVG